METPTYVSATPELTASGEIDSFVETLDIVQRGIERISKQDNHSEYRKAVKWGFANGLLRVKSESEINLEMRQKPWLAVNRIINEKCKQ